MKTISMSGFSPNNCIWGILSLPLVGRKIANVLLLIMILPCVCSTPAVALITCEGGKSCTGGQRCLASQNRYDSTTLHVGPDRRCFKRRARIQ